MNKILVSLALLFFQLISVHVGLAETLTPDQIEIKTLVKKMYEIDPDTFEYAEFGGKYKNGKVISEGKHDPKRQCQLLAEFLVKEAVIKKDKAQSCMTGNGGYFRYPLLDSMDLGSETRVAPPPMPQIKTPVLNNDTGKVQVIFPTLDANVMYYLKRQNNDWRIYRVETSRNDATIESIKKNGEGQLDKIDIFPPEK
jgi:hypothetical protein